jgi:hypothetical protein
MVHTALAGTVSIVANRPCLPTHYELYATLQVTHLFKRPEAEGYRESIPGREHVITAHLRLIANFRICIWRLHVGPIVCHVFRIIDAFILVWLLRLC